MRLTGKYRYLTFEDRKKIEAWHLLGDRPVDIEARLSVHHTTIYKELQRGATGALDANQREGYSAELAERRLRESFKRRGKRAPAAQYNEAAASYFVKNGEGWRDAWNFVDTALRLIENAEYLGDLRVIKEKGITFGPVTEQAAVPDFYPYWFAWAEFSIEETLTRNPKSYQHLL